METLRGVDNIEHNSLLCNSKNMTKYIFVTGRVVSSVGKGIVAASSSRIYLSTEPTTPSIL